MAARRRIPLLAATIGLCLATLLALGGRADAQSVPTLAGSPTTTQASSATTAAGAATGGAGSGAATTTTASDQTIIAAPQPASRRLVTESRKLMAVIGGLVVVALLLLIMTIRYWRATRPMLPGDSTPLGAAAAASAAEGVEDAAAAGDAAELAPVARGVDPVPTDEHERIDVPQAVVRPSAAARAAALGVGS